MSSFDFVSKCGCVRFDVKTIQFSFFLIKIKLKNTQNLINDVIR